MWDTGKLPAVYVLYTGPLPDPSTDTFPGPHVRGSSSGAHTRALVSTSTARPLVLLYEPAFQRMAFSPAPGVILDLGARPVWPKTAWQQARWGEGGQGHESAAHRDPRQLRDKGNCSTGFSSILSRPQPRARYHFCLNGLK